MMHGWWSENLNRYWVYAMFYVTLRTAASCVLHTCITQDSECLTDMGVKLEVIALMCHSMLH